MKATSAKIVAPRTFEFVEEELPALGDNEILIKMDSVGLCHSDLPRYTGKATIAVSSRGYRESVPVVFPCMVGHEPVGTVIDKGNKVTKFSIGDHVTGHMPTCFRTHLVINENVMIFKFPDSMPMDYRYCVAEPLGCIVNILNMATQQEPGKTAVVGCGHLGLLVISGLRALGIADITAVDLNNERLEFARQFGAAKTLNPAECDIRTAAFDLTEGHFFDTVMEITGSIRGLETACRIIKFAHENGMQNGRYIGRGRILTSSVFSGEETFPFGLAHDLMLRTPDVFNVHPSSAEDVLANDIRGVNMCIAGELPLHKMITHTCRFEDLHVGFDWLEHAPEGYNKGLVLFD